MNINTAEHWDKIWNEEGCMSWRIYPKTFMKISKIVGWESKVLELGCGVGILLSQLKEQDNEVYGIDISKSAIKQMKQIFDIDGEAGNILTCEIKGKYDWIIATEFLEHFTDKELKIILEKIKSHGKRFIFAVPNDCLGKDELEEHEQKFTPTTIQNLLSKYFPNINLLVYTDKFEAGNKKIELPTILVECWE